MNKDIFVTGIFEIYTVSAFQWCFQMFWNFCLTQNHVMEGGVSLDTDSPTCSFLLSSIKAHFGLFTPRPRMKQFQSWPLAECSVNSLSENAFLLSRVFRVALLQIRPGFCSSRRNYRPRIGKVDRFLCPHSRIQLHTVIHLVFCPTFPNHLVPLDLRGKSEPPN